MTLYEIDKQLEQLIENGTDLETGELVIDQSEFESLQMQREEKIENIALYYKNLNAEITAITDEISNLNERRDRVKRKAEKMKSLLSYALNGERFSTGRVDVKYHKSISLELDEDKFMSWAVSRPEYLRFKSPEPDKNAIRKKIQQGISIPGAELVEKMNVIIK